MDTNPRETFFGEFITAASENRFTLDSVTAEPLVCLLWCMETFSSPAKPTGPAGESSIQRFVFSDTSVFTGPPGVLPVYAISTAEGEPSPPAVGALIVFDFLPVFFVHVRRKYSAATMMSKPATPPEIPMTADPDIPEPSVAGGSSSKTGVVGVSVGDVVG